MTTNGIMFHSTNKNTPDVDFKTAIIRGQALDKGLYMLNEIPKLTEEQIYSFKDLSLDEIGFIVISNIIGNIIPKPELKKILKGALNFSVPVEHIGNNDYQCYLDQGPTASFKDFGARTLARIMEYFLEEDNKNAVILTATSGDTGGAVAQAFYEMNRIKVVVLFPKDEISDLQRKQMTTLGKNVTAIGITGKFDDCQRLVKIAFADPDLQHIGLSSANSINFGRLMPQTLYYFYSYSSVIEKKGEEVIFSVPSGNFGNLMGGLIASNMGLPVKRFISAVNENDEFPKFLETGKYEKVEPSKKCISNAMNVGHPSNFARLIDLYGGQIDETGVMHKIPDLERIRKDIVSYSITNELTKETIVNFYKKYNKKIIEPHGAVGWACLEKYRIDFPEDNSYKLINFETADPAKFPEEIISLINITPKIPKSLEIIQNKSEFPNPVVINDYSDFKNYLVEIFNK
ncbi:MAG: threonine synthase [Promethearchaeota archaeon]|nr:MAG: threonine synthase [Candidatus Lokiarchaeota archaeon]